MRRSSTINQDMTDIGKPSTSGLRERLAQAWRRFERHVAYRRSLRALAELDDRLLHDIGLTREDIRRNGMGEGAVESKRWRWAAN
jgi:uncharacterized protein YjiS (DUF1127 family)